VLNGVGTEFLTWKVIQSINSTVILAAIYHSVMSYLVIETVVERFHEKFWENLTLNFPLQLRIQQLIFFLIKIFESIFS